jgi:F-type H+-transporting ATPase subunit b
VLTALMHLPRLASVLVAAAGEHEAEEGPGPIVPDLDELLWALGSFVVFALLMRFFLFPRLKRGMDARYANIRGTHERADAMRIDARSEVADYDAQVAAIKAEGQARIDAARQTLDNERAEQMAALNARLDQQRAAARADADAAKEAVRPQIHAAVADVAGRAGELATGRKPSADVVDRVVNEVMAR